MKTQPYRIFAFLLIATLWMTACQGGSATTDAPRNTPSGSDSPGPAQPPPAGFDIPRPVSLDPANADQDAQTITVYLFEGLVKLENGQVAPALAATWIVSDDGLDYIFELRPNVSFHDGTPLDSDAVTANFNRWFDPEDPAHGSGAYDAWKAAFGGFKGEVDANGKPVSTFDGIEKVDILTVLIHLNQPDPDFLVKLAAPAFGILSPAALGDVALNPQSAVGSGPYLLGEWTETGLVLAPNPSYWGEVAAEEITVTFR